MAKDKQSSKQKTSAPKYDAKGFHVLHSGDCDRYGYNFGYDVYPDMLGYLEWLDEMYDAYAELAYDSEEYEAETREERELLKEQIERIKQQGTDKGMKVPRPCLQVRDQNSLDIEAAGYWKEFVQASFPIVLDALRNELENHDDGYEEEYDDDDPDNPRNLKQSIEALAALQKRKDIGSKRFYDAYSTLLDECVSTYLQHF